MPTLGLLCLCISFARPAQSCPTTALSISASETMPANGSEVTVFVRCNSTNHSKPDNSFQHRWGITTPSRGTPYDATLHTVVFKRDYRQPDGYELDLERFGSWFDFDDAEWIKTLNMSFSITAELNDHYTYSLTYTFIDTGVDQEISFFVSSAGEEGNGASWAVTVHTTSDFPDPTVTLDLSVDNNAPIIGSEVTVTAVYSTASSPLSLRAQWSVNVILPGLDKKPIMLAKGRDPKALETSLKRTREKYGKSHDIDQMEITLSLRRIASDSQEERQTLKFKANTTAEQLDFIFLLYAANAPDQGVLKYVSVVPRALTDGAEIRIFSRQTSEVIPAYQRYLPIEANYTFACYATPGNISNIDALAHATDEKSGVRFEIKLGATKFSAPMRPPPPVVPPVLLIGSNDSSDAFIEEVVKLTFTLERDPTLQYTDVECRFGFPQDYLPPLTNFSIVRQLQMIDLPQSRMDRMAYAKADVYNGQTGKYVGTNEIAYEGDTVVLRCAMINDVDEITLPNFMRYNESNTESIEQMVCTGLANKSWSIASDPLANVYRLNVTLSNVSQEDAGIYRCCQYIPQREFEGLKYVIMTSGTPGPSRPKVIFDVYELRVNKQEPPVLRDAFDETRAVPAGAAFDLTCPDGSGSPQPSVFWLAGDKPVSSRTMDEVSLSSNGSTLHISGISQDAVFTCVASNRFGTASKTFRVNVLKSQTPLIVSIAVASIVVVLATATLLGWKLWHHAQNLKQLRPLFDMLWTDLQSNANSRCGFICDNDDTQESLRYDRSLELSNANSIQIYGQLGEGHFSKVCKGRLLDMDVAVKMPKNPYKIEQHKSIVAELVIMCQLRESENVLRVLGAVTKSMQQGKLYLITELCEYGSLWSFLRRARKTFVVDESGMPAAEGIAESSGEITSSSGSNCNDTMDKAGDINQQELTGIACWRRRCLSRNTKSPSVEPSAVIPRIGIPDLIDFARQLGEGMAYISSNNVIHRDLAARNVLVANGLILKIADFGLSKSGDQYTIETSRRPPNRWLAIESILNLVFTPQTDVWSYGVVLWEIFSLGCTPYATLPPDESLEDYVLAGNRLQRPTFATEPIYQLMLACWNADPRKRPTFRQLTNIIPELSLSNDTQEIPSTSVQSICDHQGTSGAGSLNKGRGYVKAPMKKVYCDIPLANLP